MRIGGLIPLTTIDYPGELAAVVFCQGCPWRCPYCHNPHLQPGTGPSSIAWPNVLGFLERRRGLLDAVVFSGGEPTLHKDLGEALASVGALGLKTGLHTAGCYPEQLPELLPRLDWVGLDIKALPEGYVDLTGAPGSGEAAWHSLELVLASGTALEVRTTWMSGVSADTITEIAERLARHGVRRFVLQRCRPPLGREANGNCERAPTLSPQLYHRLRASFQQFEVR